MILGGACCEECGELAAKKRGGLGWGWDDLNPITLAKDVVNEGVDALGSVAGNVAGQVDKFVSTTLGTTLKTGAAARQLLKSPDDGSSAAPQVSYTPLVVGGLAAAGLLLWALIPGHPKAPTKEQHA